MLYGREEELGLYCSYHGWIYDTKGNCLETPAEPADSKFHLTVKMRAYPVQRYVGLLWAYLGPVPAPVLPAYDVLARKDGRRTIQLRGQVDCNYFQAMENSADPCHTSLLHQEFHAHGRELNPTRGSIDDVSDFDLYLTDYGLMKHRVYRDGRVEEHPIVFPNILRQGNGMEIRVPLDDTHTWVWEVRFHPSNDGAKHDDEPEIVPAEPHKEPMGVGYPFARYRMDRIDAQDYMAWETQGAITNRPGERLATSDRGVVMLRDLYFENIDRVTRGEDPLGVVRDPARGIIDTALTGTFEFAKSMAENPIPR
jgi:5,5'-dehydrodivanillate O-demethylase